MTPSEPPTSAGWTFSGIALGLLSALLAVLVALAALYRDRLPARLVAVARPVAPILAGVRALHSGHVGDYVAWLFVGVAGLGALVGLSLL